MGDPETCRVVRFADTGWSDIAVTNALTARVLSGLGYKPQFAMLSLQVAYVAMKNSDVDVFLGSWIPSQKRMMEPLLKGELIERLSPNLENARYSLAVMDYTYEAGLKKFGDVVKFKWELGSKIYGVEAGNEGNELIWSMIDSDAFGLRDFHLVESSEHAMLAEVDRMQRKKKHVVFLAWEPHPMNTKYSIRYLDGAVEGPAAAFGESTVYTSVRAGYSKDCPNVARLLRNIRFSIPMENEIMRMVIDDGMTPTVAAETWLKKNATVLEDWLIEVVSFNKQPGLHAVKRSIGLE